MMKRKLFVVMSVCLLLGIFAIGGTLAWLTDEDQATNAITIGNVTIDVREDNWDPQEGLSIYPGKITKKDPIVYNTGENPAYVRVKVMYPSIYGEFLEFDFDNVNWFKVGDYYYYKQVVSPNGSTTALFSQFEFLDTFIEPAVGQEVAFNIDVYAEAIQAQGFESLGVTDIEFKNAILNAFNNYEVQNP